MITVRTPNTVFLGGDRTQINDRAASEAITPGHLVELFNNAGVIRYRKHSVAGGSGQHVATERTMLNEGVDTVIPANDLIEVSALHKGANAWLLIASGQNIVAGNKLESAGNGTLRILGSGEPLFTALENKPTVITQTRIRVEAV